MGSVPSSAADLFLSSEKFPNLSLLSNPLVGNKMGRMKKWQELMGITQVWLFTECIYTLKKKVK